MRNEKDLGSKWLLERHADSVFRLLNLPTVESWRAVPAEQAAPRRIPDGLFEVTFQGHPRPTPFLLEVESEPSADADRQMLEAILLVRLAKDIVPDAALVLLRPRGHQDVAGQARLVSAGGTVTGGVAWRVIKLWELDAEDLFASGDVGIIPWVTLARTVQSPEEMLNRCRDVIDAKAPPGEAESLKVVTTIFASVTYNKQWVMDLLFKGRTVKVSDFPMLVYFQEQAVAIGSRKSIMRVLKNRFATVPDDIAARLEPIEDADRLGDLIDTAVTCQDLTEFRAKL